MAQEENVLAQIKKLSTLADEARRKERQKALLTHIQNCISTFQDAYQVRRRELLEINALYRGRSFVNDQKSNWQTKAFMPMVYTNIEAKTSAIHEGFWGNRLISPFTVIGKTPEDHAFAFSAESVLNNTMDSIGFYETSEEGIRSVCKYGLGAYRYGWQESSTRVIVRESVKDENGKTKRDENGEPILTFKWKNVKKSQPFVRAIDVVDHLGWDPTAKCFDKDQCDWLYEIREEARESILEKVGGEYDAITDVMLDQKDPHGLESVSSDVKRPELRRQDGVLEAPMQRKPRFAVVDWFGWFDIDGSGKREFIKATVLEGRLILSAEENWLKEYPIIDVQYSRSLHSLTPWGCVDPVINLQYQINELYCQRGDSIKQIINPQFLVNIRAILEDHNYVSQPGAMHPFVMDPSDDVRKAMQPMQFQALQYVSTQEQSQLINLFDRVTGSSNYNQILDTSNKDTPASTVFGIFDQQSSSNSMIVNGILNRHGVLGGRVLKLIQLLGPRTFVVRAAGRRGLEFRFESMENILGEYDTKVTTSTFFGNRRIELQNLIQLRPVWAQAPHINQVELDRAILENIMPKRVEKILNLPPEPLSPLDEELLFLAGQGESVELSQEESLADLQIKFDLHKKFQGSKRFQELDDLSREEFDSHMKRIEARIQELQMQQQLMAQQAAKAGLQQGAAPQLAGNGNNQNTGLPEVRQMGQNIRPQLGQTGAGQ